jgi:hypothetical protein
LARLFPFVVASAPRSRLNPLSLAWHAPARSPGRAPASARAPVVPGTAGRGGQSLYWCGAGPSRPLCGRTPQATCIAASDAPTSTLLVPAMFMFSYPQTGLPFEHPPPRHMHIEAPRTCSRQPRAAASFVYTKSTVWGAQEGQAAVGLARAAPAAPPRPHAPPVTDPPRPSGAGAARVRLFL